MKKHILLTSLVISILFAIGVTTASAIPVTITYTADNVIARVVGAKWRCPCSIGSWGNSNGLWPLRIRLLLTFPSNDHEYQIIWQFLNDGTPVPGNPGGFLAEIAQNPQLTEADYLSSSSWEVAVVYGSLGAPSDFSTLTWIAATEFGANNDPSVIWYQSFWTYSRYQWRCTVDLDGSKFW